MEKYKNTFWAGVSILLFQLLFLVVMTMTPDNSCRWWFWDFWYTWHIEFLLPPTLMILIGAIGVCSYHRSDDTKHIDKDE